MRILLGGDSINRMKRIVRDCSLDTRLEACPLVRRFGEKIAETAGGMPVLDVACGSGRNAIFLRQLGCTVICMDNDLSRLQTDSTSQSASGSLHPHQIDLVRDPWPFSPHSVGGIINIHFTLLALFPHFESSLLPSGYLLLETVPGVGGNYLELPKEGELKAALGNAFDYELYKERQVGPSGHNAVTVKLLARRRK
jgi:SAM-dependent methyltransferase